MQVRSRLFMVVALACGASWLCSPSLVLAQAQQPTVLRNVFQNANLSDKEQKREINALRLEKAKALQGSVGWDNSAQETLKRWLQSYVFPTMTQPDAFGELAEFRKSIRDDLRQAKPDQRQFFLDQALAGMRVLVQPQYALETRINAALMLGELNESERTVQDKAPTPYPPALPLLRALVSEQQPEAVQAAALVGVLRHVESQWAPGHQPIAAGERNALIGVMMQLAKTSDPPENRSPETQAWLRARAVEVLAGINITGPRGEVYDVFRDILQEKESPLMLRVAAAYGIGRLPYGQVKVDPTPALQGLTRLVADACELEAQRLEDLKRHEEKRLGPQPSSGGFGGLAGGVSSVAPTAGGGVSTPRLATPSGPPRGGSGKGGLASGPMSGGGMYGMMGMMGGGTNAAGDGKIGILDDYLVEDSRRRLRYHLMCAQRSLTGVNEQRQGLKPMAQGDVATHLQEVEGAVTSLMSQTKDAPEDLDDFIKLLRGKAEQMRRLLPLEVAETAPVSEAPPPLPAPPAGAN